MVSELDSLTGVYTVAPLGEGFSGLVLGFVPQSNRQKSI
jgi:hypothetical protein